MHIWVLEIQMDDQFFDLFVVCEYFFVFRKVLVYIYMGILFCFNINWFKGLFKINKRFKIQFKF